MRQSHPLINCFVYGLNDGAEDQRWCRCPVMVRDRVLCMGSGWWVVGAPWWTAKGLRPLMRSQARQGELRVSTEVVCRRARDHGRARRVAWGDVAADHPSLTQRRFAVDYFEVASRLDIIVKSAGCSLARSRDERRHRTSVRVEARESICHGDHAAGAAGLRYGGARQVPHVRYWVEDGERLRQRVRRGT